MHLSSFQPHSPIIVFLAQLLQNKMHMKLQKDDVESYEGPIIRRGDTHTSTVGYSDGTLFFPNSFQTLVFLCIFEF